MSLTFGPKWSAALPTEDLVHELAEMWGESIRNVSDATILRVLEFVKHERGEAWPPNLAEFLSLCRQFRVERDAPAQLPKPTSDTCQHGYTMQDYLRIAKEAAAGRLDKSEFGRMLTAHGIPTEPGSEGRDARIQHHADLLARYARSGRIHAPVADQYHLCGYPACRNAGTMTSSTGGSDRWYCASHFVRG